MQYPPTKTKPWEHQIEAWHKAKPHKGFYLAMDMATGKSKCAIDYCTGVNAHSILILCPKSVISVWPEQFDLHAGVEYSVLDLDKGSSRKKAEQVEGFIKRNRALGRRSVVVINYESFWREPLGPTYNKKNRIVDPGALMKEDWDVLILDEAHRIKSPGGKASWNAAKLAKKAKRKLFLSGTPFPHAPTDIYAQFRALEPDIFGTSFHRFKLRYCVMGGYENRQVVQFVNQDDMNAKFYSRAFRVMADDVLDLPDAMHELRECDLSPKAMKLYKSLEKDFIVELENGDITVSNALVKLLRLSQMTGGYAQLDDGGEEIIDSAKLDTLKDVLTDLPQQEPVVIFSRFRSEIKRIKKLCDELGRSVAELSGKANELKEWKEGKYNAIVVQIRSGSLGVNFTRARYCIFFSTGYSLGDYQQAIKRIHRPGQTRKVVYYHIMARNTVDVAISKSLREKKSVVENVLMKMSDRPKKVSEKVISALEKHIQDRKIREAA